MQTTTKIIHTADLRQDARLKYWAGYRVSEISEQLGIPNSTVHYWKESEKWDDLSPVSRVEASLEARLNLLILKNDKSGRDFKEIDLLTRQLERTARIRKYSNGGNESDLNPNIKNRNKGPKKPRDKNPISEEQKKLLIDNFLTEMFDYQKEWYEAGKTNRIRNILKSRQIGATYYFAHEAFIDALQTGRNQIFLSASKKQALQFRSYIVDYAKRVADVELKGETILLPNGAELIFLGTNSKTAQSYHGNLYVDEYFWIPRFEELRKVASGMASQKKYRQTYFSTPSTIAHPAYSFWSGKRFNKNRPKSEQVEIDILHDNLQGGKYCADGQWRQIVDIYDAENGGCNLFDIEQLKLEYSPAEFEQLFMCGFIDDNESIFKLSVLQKCLVDSWEIWEDLSPLAQRPFKDKEVWLGYDPSNTGDRAALAIIAPSQVENGKFRVLQHETFKGMDFKYQADKIKEYCAKYNVTRICIDATGLGAAVYQLVKQFRPDAIAINYNIEVKNLMVLKTLDVINNGRLEYDTSANDITVSFMSIKRQITQSGKYVTYVADRSEEVSHADIAWAIMHALINEPLDNSSGLGDLNRPRLEIY